MFALIDLAIFRRFHLTWTARVKRSLDDVIISAGCQRLVRSVTES